MILSRRALLGMTSVGAVVIGTGLLAGTAHAKPLISKPIPPNRHQRLRAQPPYRHAEDQYRKRFKRTKHKPRLKARSLRAQRTYDTPGNRRALALTMWGEARGYGTLGMEAIGHVVMNRVKAAKKRFGSGIEGVCYKRKQFSCHNPSDNNHKRMKVLPTLNESNPDWVAFIKADRLASLILAGALKDNTGGATHYFAETMDHNPYWIGDMVIVGVMFGHLFCKEKSRRQRKKNRSLRNTRKSRH